MTVDIHDNYADIHHKANVINYPLYSRVKETVFIGPSLKAKPQIVKNVPRSKCKMCPTKYNGCRRVSRSAKELESPAS